MNKVLTSKWTKVVLFVLCLVPFGALIGGAYRTYTGVEPLALTANPIEYITHETGDWTVRFLLITLTITPLRIITRQPLLTRFRRMLGLFAFFYVMVHFSIWFGLDKMLSLSAMWEDVVKRRFITAGMLGLAAMVPLAITSTAGWVRRLGYKRWQKLHRLVYLSAAAGVIHYYWLVKSDIRMPALYGAILTVLLLYRVVHAKMSAPPARKPVPAAVK